MRTLEGKLRGHCGHVRRFYFKGWVQDTLFHFLRKGAKEDSNPQSILQTYMPICTQHKYYIHMHSYSTFLIFYLYLIRKLYFTVRTVGKYIRYNENSQGRVFQFKERTCWPGWSEGEEQVCETQVLAKLKLLLTRVKPSRLLSCVELIFLFVLYFFPSYRFFWSPTLHDDFNKLGSILIKNSSECLLPIP